MLSASWKMLQYLSKHLEKEPFDPLCCSELKEMLLHGGRGNAFLLAATNGCQWVSLWALSLSLSLENTKVKDGVCYPQVEFLQPEKKGKRKKETIFFLTVARPKKEIFSSQLSFFFNSVIPCKTGSRQMCVLNSICQKQLLFQRHLFLQFLPTYFLPWERDWERITKQVGAAPGKASLFHRWLVL